MYGCIHDNMTKSLVRNTIPLRLLAYRIDRKYTPNEYFQSYSIQNQNVILMAWILDADFYKRYTDIQDVACL